MSPTPISKMYAGAVIERHLLLSLVGFGNSHQLWLTAKDFPDQFVVINEEGNFLGVHQVDSVISHLEPGAIYHFYRYLAF